MKGMTTQVMVIIFSLAIMVILLYVSLGFLNNYTNIPFENLWELTPQSGTVTEVHAGNVGGVNVGDITTKRFFTTGIPFDLSEVACDIGTAIYKDFLANGYADTRPVSQVKKYGSGHYYLIDDGVFLYNNTMYSAASYGSDPVHGYVTGTDTHVADSKFNVDSDHAACRICRYPEMPGDLAGAVKVAGIKDLDETCINMQLKGRQLSGGGYFCDGSSFHIGTNGPYDFGNAWGYHVDEWIRSNVVSPDPNNVLINVTRPSTGYSWDQLGDYSKTGAFCTDSNDYIDWEATGNYWNQPWKVSDFPSEDYSGPGNAQNNALVNGYLYIYQVWWTHLEAFPGWNNKYYIIFTMLPDENRSPSFTSFDILNSTANPVVGERSSRIGWYVREARTSSFFNVSLTGGQTESIEDLRERIAKAFMVDISKVTCTSCSNTPAGEPKDNIHSVGSDCLSGGVILWTNATITPQNYDGRLPSGNYRVVVRDWSIWNDDDNHNCYEDKSVSIYKLS